MPSPLLSTGADCDDQLCSDHGCYKGRDSSQKYKSSLFSTIPPFGRREAFSMELLWELHTSSQVALQQSRTLESILDLITGKESGLAVAEFSL